MFITRQALTALSVAILLTGLSSCATYKAAQGAAAGYIEQGLDEKHELNKRATYYSRRWVCEDISVRALQEWLVTQELMDSWDTLCGKDVAIPPTLVE